MKIKILKSSGWYKGYIETEFEVDGYHLTSSADLRFSVFNHGWIYSCDCIITELPESFCVKKSDDVEKWNKCINWLNKTYGACFNGIYWSYYGVECYRVGNKDEPFGTEIHIDDMIKHIDYMESRQHIKGGEQFYKESQLTYNMRPEFDLTTNEGKLAYAKKYYPIGTKYISLGSDGQVYRNSEITSTPRYFGSCIEGGFAYIYANGKWAEIIKEEINMGTQKLSRQGLKEIHSVACSSWKITLEGWGSRNPLEDYIELSQKEIDMMFNASDDNQKSILSKYLKQDDGSVDVSGCDISPKLFIDVRKCGEYKNKSFWLSDLYDWEIKTDEDGDLCLIPTKIKK